MRRDTRLISIYDKPLQRRRSVAPAVSASSEYGTAILACVAIVLTTTAFFWIYDAVARSRMPFVPPTHAGIHARTDVLRVPIAVPAPDMNAPEVRHAEADVPRQPAAVAEARSIEAKKSAVATNAHKKKATRTAHLPAEARQAYAAGTWFHGPVFGGF